MRPNDGYGVGPQHIYDARPAADATSTLCTCYIWSTGCERWDRCACAFRFPVSDQHARTRVLAAIMPTSIFMVNKRWWGKWAVTGFVLFIRQRRTLVRPLDARFKYACPSGQKRFTTIPPQHATRVSTIKCFLGCGVCSEWREVVWWRVYGMSLSLRYFCMRTLASRTGWLWFHFVHIALQPFECRSPWIVHTPQPPLRYWLHPVCSCPYRVRVLFTHIINHKFIIKQLIWHRVAAADAE